MGDLYVITAVGKDRPGIVAALARAVYSVGGNLDDATMTRLHGTFATMVSLELPPSSSVQSLMDALEPLQNDNGLHIHLESVEPRVETEAEPDHQITVYGADKPGIVYRVAEALADSQINITDMDTRVAGTLDSPIYVMHLQVESADKDIHAVLASVRQELAVDITVQALENEAL